MSQDYNLNVDGNKSNFDTLAGALHRFGDKFSFIGLAETGLNSESRCRFGAGLTPVWRQKCSLAPVWHRFCAKPAPNRRQTGAKLVPDRRQ